MARIIYSALVSDISGQVGKNIVFASWKGQSYVREYTIPMNANTSSQQVLRGYFSSAVTAWHAETTGVHTAWTNYAKAHSLAESGYNLYVGQYVKFMNNSSGTPPTATTTPPNVS